MMARRKRRTFRVRSSLDALLIAEAHINGRSVSEEIEARLERAFESECSYFVGSIEPLEPKRETPGTHDTKQHREGAD